MIAAIIFAHYFFMISEKYCYVIDWYIFGIPLSKRISGNLEPMTDYSSSETGQTLGAQIKNY
jgi:hypothetical protein